MPGFVKTSTPPPVAQGMAILTPPMTGKRERAAGPHESRKRLQTAFDEVAPFGQLQDEEELSDKDWESLCGDSPSTPISYPATPITPPPPSGPPNLALDCLLTFKEDVAATPMEKPFNFMKLPLLIRQRIYNMVLVIPAIVCVRQKHTAFHDQKMAYLYGEHRELLPGIAYALAQLTVDGTKFKFSRFRSINTNILRVSRQVHTEAKGVMYGCNIFEIVAPFSEMSPAVNYKVPLFPRGYQRLIKHLTMRVRAGYPMGWLLGGGYADVKKAYAGLETLTIVFEMETADKGLAKRWAKKDDEHWVSYVKRLRGALGVELSRPCQSAQRKPVTHVPLWINLHVLFDGERYDDIFDTEQGEIASDRVASLSSIDVSQDKEEASRLALKRGLPQAFELFKKGGR